MTHMKNTEKKLTLRGWMITCSLFILTFLPVLPAEPVSSTPSDIEFKQYALNVYNQLIVNNSSLPEYEVFAYALKGFYALKRGDEIKKNILTVVDFRLSSNDKRMWVMDLEKKKVIFNDLVAHGRNSGNKYAKKFSNVPETNMSSLGFYITGSTYYGKHGLSMLLHGKDIGFNDNAKKRAIVMHGADYVSPEFVRKYGRLGRSLGCPSVPATIYKELINTLANGACLFIYYPDEDYLRSSQLIS